MTRDPRIHDFQSLVDCVDPLINAGQEVMVGECISLGHIPFLWRAWNESRMWRWNLCHHLFDSPPAVPTDASTASAANPSSLTVPDSASAELPGSLMDAARFSVADASSLTPADSPRALNPNSLTVPAADRNANPSSLTVDAKPRAVKEDVDAATTLAARLSVANQIGR